jgi:hypothetical protein
VKVPVMMAERESAMAKSATVENTGAAKTPAMEYGAAATEAAAMKHRAASAKAPASMEASAAMKTSAANMAATTEMAATTATAMPAADLSRQPFRDVFSYGRRARIDKRKRLGALARCRRQHQHRGSRKTQATDNAAPGIWNLDHA